jgi:hypothetical protein
VWTVVELEAIRGLGHRPHVTPLRLDLLLSGSAPLLIPWDKPLQMIGRDKKGTKSSTHLLGSLGDLSRARAVSAEMRVRPEIGRDYCSSSLDFPFRIPSFFQVSGQVSGFADLGLFLEAHSKSTLARAS